MTRTKRGPTRPWSARLLAEARHLEALAERFPAITLHASNRLTQAAREVRAAAEAQAKRETRP